MRFSEVVGHDKIKAILRRFFAEEKIPHALLFHGEEGVGKRTVALAFFSLINCLNPTNDMDSCGECLACRQITTLSFPDLYVIRKPEDKTVIGIDTIREVLGRVYFKPVSGRYRCILLDDAHFLSPEAGNAMLKVLEEPPRNNVFVLVTDSPDALLPTVLSRCCSISFGSLSQQEVVAVLRKLLPQEDSHELTEVSLISKGSVSKALSMLKVALDRRLFIHDFFRALNGDSAEKLAFSKSLVSSKDDTPHLIALLKIVLQDLLLCATKNEDLVANKDLLDDLRDMASRLSISDILECLRLLHQLEKNRPFSPNPQVAIAGLLFSVASKSL